MKAITLKAARQKKRWTQEQLEAVSGVSQSVISKIEAGLVSDPNNSTAEALERALDLPRGTLRFGQREAVA